MDNFFKELVSSLLREPETEPAIGDGVSCAGFEYFYILMVHINISISIEYPFLTVIKNCVMNKICIT